MIDVYILADELGGKVVEGVSEEGGARTRLDLSGVRLWDGGVSDPEPGCIYVADAADASGIPNRYRSSAFAFVGDIEACAVADDREGDSGPRSATASACTTAAACLLLPDALSIQSSFAGIQRVFERFASTEHEAVEVSAQGRPISEVLDVCASVLSNPVALFDSTFSLLATSGYVGLGKSDIYWDAVVDNGYTGDALPFEWDPDQVLGSDGPVYHDYGDIATLDASIKQEEKVVGLLSCTNLTSPITEGEISRFEWVQRQLETLWMIIAQSVDRLEMKEQLLSRVVDGLPINEELAARIRKQYGWDSSGNYQILSIFRSGEVALTISDAAPIKRDLSAIFPGAPVVVHGDELLLVLYGGRGEGAIHGRAFLNMLALRGLKCAVSEKIPGFGHLRNAYAQCKAVRNISKPDGVTSVTEFWNVRAACMLDAFEATGLDDALCFPQVESMLQRNNGLELMHSARVYLINGRSLGAASEMLGIHRNTLRYRIDQVEKWTGIKIDELDEMGLFQMYISCFIVEKRALGSVEDFGIAERPHQES